MTNDVLNFPLLCEGKNLVGYPISLTQISQISNNSSLISIASDGVNMPMYGFFPLLPLRWIPNMNIPPATYHTSPSLMFEVGSWFKNSTTVYQVQHATNHASSRGRDCYGAGISWKIWHIHHWFRFHTCYMVDIYISIIVGCCAWRPQGLLNWLTITTPWA